MSLLDAILALAQGLGTGVGIGVVAAAVFVVMVPTPRTAAGSRVPADGPAHRAACPSAIAGPAVVPLVHRAGGTTVTRHRRVAGQHRLRMA